MCDYSLEFYRSRPAQAGEKYETCCFPSGTVGFIAPVCTENLIRIDWVSESPERQRRWPHYFASS